MLRYHIQNHIFLDATLDNWKSTERPVDQGGFKTSCGVKITTFFEFKVFDTNISTIIQARIYGRNIPINEGKFSQSSTR